MGLSTFTIFGKAAGEFGDMTLAAAINWLQEIADAQPCPPEDVTFSITQWGDHWDGYSEAEIEIYRMETESEAAERQEREATAQRQREQEARERELATLADLQLKYGKGE